MNRTSIHIKYGSMTLIYRNTSDILVNKRALTFTTTVTCLGNNTVSILNDYGEVIGTKRAYTLYDEQFVTETDTYIPNPTLIDYVPTGTNLTKVTAYLPYIDEFKFIEGR